MARELLLLLSDCSSYRLRNEQPKVQLIEAIMQEIDIRENMDMTTLIEMMEKWNNGKYKKNRKVKSLENIFVKIFIILLVYLVRWIEKYNDKNEYTFILFC